MYKWWYKERTGQHTFKTLQWKTMGVGNKAKCNTFLWKDCVVSDMRLEHSSTDVINFVLAY
jgi:hypothetical protein